MRHLRLGIISKALLGFFMIALAGISLAPCLRAQEATPAYKNPALPIEQRVDDLISRMTLEEKALQMQNGAPVRT